LLGRLLTLKMLGSAHVKAFTAALKGEIIEASKTQHKIPRNAPDQLGVIKANRISCRFSSETARAEYMTNRSERQELISPFFNFLSYQAAA
jgi:hypothetical protein